jgi:hypothetical protein
MGGCVCVFIKTVAVLLLIPFGIVALTELAKLFF